MLAARPKFRLKLLADGRAMLNLACGTRMHDGWNNLDFSPYARIARHPRLGRWLHSLGFLSPTRRERLRQIDPQIIAWDLRKGIPFDDNTFDVVYHSHFLEHLERKHVHGFLRECLRVLKAGGVLRVVVPDLEFLVSRYLETLRMRESGQAEASALHRQTVADLFDQMVRSQATGINEQTPLVRFVERILRGDAGATGERHRWMYDKCSLADVLNEAGLIHVSKHTCVSSRIRQWQEFRLDADGQDTAWKPESLYMEGIKPN